MGLGGYLCWTAVAREIIKKTGSHVKIMPVEQYGSFFRFISKDIAMFEDNSDFCLDYCTTAKNGNLVLPLILNNSEANYCKKDTPEKAVHKTDKHIIEQYCEVYGITNPELRCYLTPDMKDAWFKKELSNMFKRPLGEEIPSFITIEPNSNFDYTPNRAYPFEKWQKIVNMLQQHLKQRAL